MRRTPGLFAGAFLLLVFSGCDSQVAGPVAAPSAGVGVQAVGMGVGAAGGPSDPEKVRSADYSVLFIGNSHTMFHDLPALVGRMIESRHPGKAVYLHTLGVSFLEDVARVPDFQKEIETRQWKSVVLQAQKISASGKFDYSRKEGIEFARLARAKGADVYFFVEWGRKGVVGDGTNQEKVYREMAAAAEARIAPISRAWDLALGERPDLPLYEFDGNHESAIGAFLTACVLYGCITGESPAPLAAFEHQGMNLTDRGYLARAAAKALEGK
jgi:hypothetical protein